jgi:hypothetical protein
VSPLQWAAGGLVAALLTTGLVVGSALPYAVNRDERALVRLSWRAVGEPVKECRVPTPEELAALPQHMRRPEICEARLSPFHLRVAIDGRAVFDGQILPSGARQDRPTYVFEEFSVAPGEHRLEIRFAEERGEVERELAPLTLDETVTLRPRDILLVARPRDEDALALITPGPRE